MLNRLCGGVDESEDVIEDEVATSSIGQELEGLGVRHGSLLLVDLLMCYISTLTLLSFR